MNMKQKIRFNFKLYLEGLRQLRVTGVIGLILMIGAPILLAISMANQQVPDVPTTMTGVEYQMLLLFNFISFMPIFTMLLFQFLNKRNASDFYHVIPHTRSTVYLSFTLSVLTWIIVLIASSVVTGIICASINHTYMTLEINSLLAFAIYCISACFVVGGAIMIAKGLTGTILNSLILTAIILFLPRFLITLFISTLENHPMLRECMGNAFTEASINPVIGIVFYFLGIDNSLDIYRMVCNVPTILYGFGLGLIYYVLGGILYCRRSSETATQSAPNRILQAIYRIIVAMIMCSLLITVLFQQKELYKADIDVSTYVIIYIIIIFVYFLYELLTTRKLKNLIHAIPTLAIVAVLNVALYFGIQGAYNSALKFRPAADEINSITVLSEDIHRDTWLDYRAYVLSEVGGIELDDPEIIQDVSDCMNRYMDIVENSSVAWDSMKMEIETNGATKKRNVYLTNSCYQAINEALAKNEKFRKEWMSLPQSKYISILPNLYQGEGASEEYDLYQMFCDEMKNVSFEEWYECSETYASTQMTFVVHTVLNGKSYNVEIPVYDKLAPNTLTSYLNIVETQQKNKLEEAHEALTEIQKTGAEVNGNIYVSVEDRDSVLIYDDNLIFENADVPLHILNSIADKPMQESAYFVQINMDIWYVKDGNASEDEGIEGTSSENLYYYFMLPADEETIRELKNIGLEQLGSIETTVAAS